MARSRSPKKREPTSLRRKGKGPSEVSPSPLPSPLPDVIPHLLELDEKVCELTETVAQICGAIDRITTQVAFTKVISIQNIVDRLNALERELQQMSEASTSGGE